MPTRLALVATTLLVVLMAHAADSNTAAAKTKQLIEVLRSDAALFQKGRACQQLGEFGTADAVPVLAGLLGDPKLSAYARSGLEGIPDPSAAAALRQAVTTVQGPQLAGVVNSLGKLRDATAVELLARLASDQGSGVAKEALLALGNIATPPAVRVLREALANGAPNVRDDAAAGCLLAADRQRTTGQRAQALALYDLLRKPPVPLAIQVGATRGAILARDTDRVPFLLEQLNSPENATRHAALLTLREIPSDALATALNAEIARATPELQEELLPALADCHTVQSVDVVRGLADSPAPEVRKTALGVLGRLGQDAAPVLLAALKEERPTEERAIVLNGLRTLQGPGVDDVLRRGLSAGGTPALRTDLIRVLDSRGATSAVPELMEQAAAPEKEPRLAALACLRTLAGADQVPGLVLLAKSSRDAEVNEAIENALAGICDRSSERACATILTELTRATQSSERKSWIRVLARAGCTQALPSLEAAANDPDPAVAAAAIAELGRWPNPAPMATLLKALESASKPVLQKQALASVLDLASAATDETQAPAPVIAGWLRQAARVAQSTEDKRRVLGVLGRLKTVESFRLLAPYLEDPTVRNEAALGIIQIAPALARTEESGALKETLQKIAATTQDNDLRKRALQAAKEL